MSEGTETAAEIEAEPADAEPADAEPADAEPADAEPADAAAPDEAPATDAADESPAAEPEDLANLLGSEERETATLRVRVASDRDQVDHSERMRNFYAKTFRPTDNPPRVYFAARGAFAMAGTSEGSGGGRLASANVEAGQTWNYLGYGIGATIYGGGLTFGENGVSKFGGVLIGAGPSLGLGRLALLGRGYLDLRVGYNFFYAPISSTRPEAVDPPNAAPHGPKIQVDIGMLLHDSERRRFRHGLGATIGWQMLVHTFVGEYPRLNTFNVGIGYFFG